jgi:hypothetical protein
VADEISIVVRAEDRFSSVLGDFGNIMTGIKSIVDLSIGAFKALAEPVIDFGREAILAAARVDELGVVNQVLADNAGLSRDAVIGAADAVRSMGIEAGVSQKVVAEFIKANLDIAYAADVARVAQDAAVISGLNSTEVTERIIHGITTLNPLILRNAGIIVDLQMAYKDWADENGRTIDSLTTAEKQMIAMNAVIEAGTGIAGAYAAAMEEPGKVLRSFPRYFDDIMIAVGEPFQDAFAKVIFIFADFAKWLGQALQEGGELYPILVNIADAIEGFVDAGIERIPEFVDWIVKIKEAFDEAGISAVIDITFGQITMEDIEQFISDIDSSMADTINSYDWMATGEAFGNTLAKIFSSEGLNLNDDTETIQALGTAISDFLLGAMAVGSWEEAEYVARQIVKEHVFKPMFVEAWEAEFDADAWVRDILVDPIKNSEAWNAEFDADAWMTDNIIDPLKNWEFDADQWAEDISENWTDAFYNWEFDADTWVKDSVVDPIKNSEAWNAEFDADLYFMNFWAEISSWSFDADDWVKNKVVDPIKESEEWNASWDANLFFISLWNAQFDADTWVKNKVIDPIKNSPAWNWSFDANAFGADLWNKLSSVSFDANAWFIKIWNSKFDANVWMKTVSDAFVNAAREATQGLRDGLFSWSFDADAWAKQNLIDPIKRALGIQSPSTVFFGVGRDIVLGLIGGIQSMLGGILAYLETFVMFLLQPFAPLLELLSIDLGGTSTGSTDGRDTGGGTGGTIPSGEGTVNNYFYGTVIFGDMSQLGYDCPYPNPLLSSTSQSIVNPGY